MFMNESFTIKKGQFSFQADFKNTSTLKPSHLDHILDFFL